MKDVNEIRMSVDSFVIYQPRYTDEQRTRIKALVQTPDGRWQELSSKLDDPDSRFVRDVFAQFSVDEIDRFTRQERDLLEQKRKLAEQRLQDESIAEEREITFQSKAKALELPEVKACPDKRVARKIRKAKSAFEVAGWLAVAFMKSLEAEDVALEEVVAN